MAALARRSGLMAMLALVAFLGCRPLAPPPPVRYHVVLVVIDTLRADRIGANGSSLQASPVLDRLAAEGIDFTNAFAAATWTRPSMASMMTSLYPSEHGMLDISSPAGGAPEILDERLLTLAEAFTDGGYDTVGIVNQIYLQFKYGFGQGFGHYQGTRGRSAFQLNQRFGAWLADYQPGAEGRLFAYLHYLDPHWPYSQRLGNLPADRFGPPGPLDAPNDGSQAQAWAEAHLDDARLAALAARYAHEVAWSDAAVGQVVDQLTTAGLWEETILVVTSDHGEGFWEHGKLLHGYGPYDELLRVPLIVRLPAALRGADGRQEEAAVSLVDLMPTLLDLVGLPIPETCRGRSLAPLIRGTGSLPPAPIFAETESTRAVRADGHKLILHHDERLEHYDLAADPGERDDLGARCDSSCRKAVRQVQAFAAALVPFQATDRPQAEVSPEELEALRALGYIDAQ